MFVPGDGQTFLSIPQPSEARQNPHPQTQFHSSGDICVKKFVLATIVLSFCSGSFVQLPGAQGPKQESAIAIKKQDIEAAPRNPAINDT
jgi:hypothetical protein